MTGLQWAEAFRISMQINGFVARKFSALADEPRTPDEFRPVLHRAADELMAKSEQSYAIMKGILRAFEVPGW